MLVWLKVISALVSPTDRPQSARWPSDALKHGKRLQESERKSQCMFLAIYRYKIVVLEINIQSVY